MAIRILIPTPLRAFTGQQAELRLEGRNVGELLENLVARHGELRPHLFTPDGKLRSFVNVYVNDNDIRYLDRERTTIAESDTLSIIPSVAGGAPGTVTDGVTDRVQEDELPALTNDEVRRYSRHLIMPEVGVEGQRRIKAARVVCIGAGGLGSPASERSVSSISTRSISAICSGRCCTTPRTSGGRSWRQPKRGSPASIRK
jgi:sulfur-carrier protein adenylyltransferase/sulfurtransferase